MIRKVIWTLGVVALIVGLTANPVKAFSGSGSGTADNPYIITTVNQLQEMEDNPGAHYALGNDIDASATASWKGRAGFAPIGKTPWWPDYGTPFTGSFDGRGHKIYNLYVNRPTAYHVGLFGYIRRGVVNNVGLESVNVIGDYAVGGLVGFNNGTVSNSYSTGSVSGNNYVGGLVGFSNGTVSDSYSTGSVSGNDRVGGLVGRNDGTVSDSYSTGSVSGDSYYTGGLVGFNNGTVSNSYSTGSVNGHSSVGGLVGWNCGSVSGSYSTGSVSGNNYVGGLVGFSNGTVSDSYSTGSVSGNDRVGGLVGRNDGTVSDSYSTGSVSGDSYYTCGLIGFNYGTVSSSFWDIETSGQVTSAGGTGKTTAEMKDINTFAEAGWNIVLIPDYVNDYPRLGWQDPTSDKTWYIGEGSSSPAPVPVSARLRIEPETLNLKSKGKFVAFIESIEGYSPKDVRLSSIQYSYEVAGTMFVADCEKARIAHGKIVVTFDRRGIVDIPDDEKLIVTGNLRDDKVFSGSDTIRFIK